MKTKKKPATPPIADSPSSGPTHHEIALFAYQMWEQEGHPEGCDIMHWQQAEAMLLAMLLVSAEQAKPA